MKFGGQIDDQGTTFALDPFFPAVGQHHVLAFKGEREIFDHIGQDGAALGVSSLSHDDAQGEQTVGTGRMDERLRPLSGLQRRLAMQIQLRLGGEDNGAVFP